jgi:hypothetical protein
MTQKVYYYYTTRLHSYFAEKKFYEEIEKKCAVDSEDPKFPL